MNQARQNLPCPPPGGSLLWGPRSAHAPLQRFQSDRGSSLGVGCPAGRRLHGTLKTTEQAPGRRGRKSQVCNGESPGAEEEGFG